ncbi:HNH endonuclease [Nostoc sp.]|uniref:HNH endonuclease n=1 Tax=Nostoc sp. TaxID=1180 RepID=UPI003FA5992D
MGHRRCFSFAQKRLILLRSGYCCELCGVKLTIENFHCDHKIPYSRGGATAVYNGQALCATCNRKKSDSV